MRFPVPVLLSAVGVLAACASDTTSSADPSAASSLEAGAPDAVRADGGPGALYTASNAVGGNAVLAFNRSADGTLGAPTAYPTGGTGTGGGLGNQGAVTLSRDGTLARGRGRRQRRGDALPGAAARPGARRRARRRAGIVRSASRCTATCCTCSTTARRRTSPASASRPRASSRRSPAAPGRCRRRPRTPRRCSSPRMARASSSRRRQRTGS